MLSKCKQKSEAFFRKIMVAIDKVNSEFDRDTNKYMWILGIVYRIIMDAYFILAIDPIYGYLGLACNPSIIDYAISWVCYLFGYYMILQVKNKVVSVFLHIQWVLMVVPVIMLYGFQSQRSIAFLLFVMAVVLLQAIIGRREKNAVVIGFGNKHLINYITVFMCIAVVAVWAVMAVWNDFAGLKAFDWDYIYEMRANLVYPPFFRYLVSWITRAIIPWLLIVGLDGRKVFLIIYSLFFQTMFYMILGHKLPLLLMAVVLAVYVLAQLKVLLTGMYAGLAFVSVVCTGSYLLESLGGQRTSILLNALYGMRTLFYPAMVKYQHFEFFSEYPKVGFADGMIGKLFSQTNLYANSLGVTVYAFFNNGSTASQSNTGYLADSYDQLGFIGMLLIGVLVILVVKFISKYMTYIPLPVLYCVVAYFVVSLNDNAFFTTFLTGGLWILLLMLMISVKGGKSNDKL